MTALIGADPEVLLEDRDGVMRSVEGLVGGTKDAPVPIPGLEEQFLDGAAMQEDNVMLEFNIEPTSCAMSASHIVDNTMGAIKRGVLEDAGLIWHRSCYAEYPASQLSTAQAATFGCSPDMDAYENAKAGGVSPSILGNYRCAGGHIHLGYNNREAVPPFVVVQLADALIGLWEVYYKESQGVRRQHYGTAGRFRVKPYGVEYRTPSNAWLFNVDLRDRMFRGANCLGRMLDEGDTAALHRVFTELPRMEVARAINQEDTSAARQLVKFVQTLIEETGREL